MSIIKRKLRHLGTGMSAFVVFPIICFSGGPKQPLYSKSVTVYKTTSRGSMKRELLLIIESVMYQNASMCPQHFSGVISFVIA